MPTLKKAQVQATLGDKFAMETKIRDHVVRIDQPKTSGGQTWPCGACLQVALELGGPDLPVHVGSVDPEVPIASSTVGDLLPLGPKIDR